MKMIPRLAFLLISLCILAGCASPAGRRIGDIVIRNAEDQRPLRVIVVFTGHTASLTLNAGEEEVLEVTEKSLPTSLQVRTGEGQFLYKYDIPKPSGPLWWLSTAWIDVGESSAEFRTEK